MKINKKNPEHLYELAVSAANSFLTVMARPFIRKRNPDERIVIFYGHTLNGNLKSFYDFLNKKKGYRPYFLALDVHYFRR